MYYAPLAMRVRSRRHPRLLGGALQGAALALGAMLAAGTGDAAPAKAPARSARVVERARTPRSPGPPRKAVAGAARPDGGVAPLAGAAWAASLPPIRIRNKTTSARATLRLYADDGGLDRAPLREFMRVASSAAAPPDDGEVPEPLDPRLVQLVVRAAYHFGNAPILVISATRKGSRGKHSTGDALDFQLEGVRAAKLAAYARTFPRAGVGIYTHPKTQFVHVDVRDRSYHWIDGSPPGVTWRERRLRDPKQDRRDASYAPILDLPEAAVAR